LKGREWIFLYLSLKGGNRFSLYLSLRERIVLPFIHLASFLSHGERECPFLHAISERK
jgi:hypothetical protein